MKADNLFICERENIEAMKLQKVLCVFKYKQVVTVEAKCVSLAEVAYYSLW